jgi:hypothetical protein
MCLRWSEQRDCGRWSLSSTLQEFGRQSAERHDSEHRGPAVVTSEDVSWNRGNVEDVFLNTEELLLISSILQVLVRQSTDRHDSEHRGPAVVAYDPVSWKRGDDGGVVALV